MPRTTPSSSHSSTRRRYSHELLRVAVEARADLIVVGRSAKARPTSRVTREATDQESQGADHRGRAVISDTRPARPEDDMASSAGAPCHPRRLAPSCSRRRGIR